MATTNIQMKIKGGSASASSLTGASNATSTIFSTGADEYAKVFIKADISVDYSGYGKILIGGQEMAAKSVGSGGFATAALGIFELVVPPNSSLAVRIEPFGGNMTVSYGASWTFFSNTI